MDLDELPMTWGEVRKKWHVVNSIYDSFSYPRLIIMAHAQRSDLCSVLEYCSG